MIVSYDTPKTYARTGSSTNLSCSRLAYETAHLLFGNAIGSKAEPFNMRMSGGPILAATTLDFTNLHHIGSAPAVASE